MAQPPASSTTPRRHRSSGPDVGELIEAFLDGLASGGASTHTLGAYRRDLRGVADRMATTRGLADIAELRLSQVDSVSLEAAMAAWATDHAPASVARAWAAWSSFFTYLISQDIARANPTEAAQRPKPPPPAPKLIGGGDVSERLLSAAAMPEPSSPSAWAERDVALVATLGLTGLGVSEVLSLSLGSLHHDSSGGLVLVTGAVGQDQVVPLQPALADLIDAYLASRKAWLGSESADAALFIDASAQPMTSSKVQYLIQRLYERSGLDSQVPERTAVQALHATFAAEAVAHWAEVLRDGLTAPPRVQGRRTR
jgi:site-specific recombinase XerD